VLRHLKTISEKVKKELAKTSPLANKIYESYTKFQSEYEAYQTLAGRYQPL
jgi:TRAP-type mannitol/chloroaromatic compound transport system substrate-binding protein